MISSFPLTTSPIVEFVFWNLNFHKFFFIRLIIESYKNTNTFKSKHFNKIFQIKKNFNCNCKMVVYLIEYRVCGKQHNSSIVTKVHVGSNNYKTTQSNFWKEQKWSNQVHNQKVFTNFIFRAIITRFATGRQHRNR